MRCNILNCNHKAKKATKGSWARFGICSCCAFELYLLNEKDMSFFAFNRKPLNKCNEYTNPNPFGIPTKTAMISLLKEKPMNKLELKQYLVKYFNKTISNVTFNKHFADLKRE